MVRGAGEVRPVLVPRSMNRGACVFLRLCPSSVPVCLPRDAQMRSRQEALPKKKDHCSPSTRERRAASEPSGAGGWGAQRPPWNRRRGAPPLAVHPAQSVCHCAPHKCHHDEVSPEVSSKARPKGKLAEGSAGSRALGRTCGQESQRRQACRMGKPPVQEHGRCSGGTLSPLV